MRRSKISPGHNAAFRRTEAHPPDRHWQLPHIVPHVPHHADHLTPRPLLAFGFLALALALLGAPARDADREREDDEADRAEFAKLAVAEPGEERRVAEVEVAEEVAKDVADVGVAAEPGCREALEGERGEIEGEGLQQRPMLNQSSSLDHEAHKIADAPSRTPAARSS